MCDGRRRVSLSIMESGCCVSYRDWSRVELHFTLTYTALDTCVRCGLIHRDRGHILALGVTFIQGHLSTFKFGLAKSLLSSRFMFLLIIPHMPQRAVCWCYGERLVAAALVSLQVAKKQEKMRPRKYDTTRLDMHTYITLAHAQFHVQLPASDIETKKLLTW